MELRRYIGDRHFYKVTLAIALPIMAQQFVASFVNLIDNIMIGSVGATALTAVTVANRFYLIFNSTMFGFCGAAGIFIAQYYGACSHEKCQKVLNINLFFAFIIGLLFMVSLWLFPTSILHLFTSNEIIIQEALQYVKYALWTYLPFAISFSIMMSLRAVGINKIQLLIGVLTVAINTTLNYILIFGHFGFPSLGIKGAAIATAIARIIEMCIYLGVLISKKYYFIFEFKGIFHLDFTFIASMVRKAIPLTINEVMYSIGLSLVFISYMRVDDYLIAAISVVDTVVQIALIIFSGLSSAIAILIGNRLGANQIDEAKANARKLITFGVMCAIVNSSILACFAPFIASCYNMDDIILNTIVTLLRIKACVLPFYVYNISIFYVLRAGGDALSTMLMDSGFLWVCNVFISTVISLTLDIPLVTLYIIIESIDLVKIFVSTYFLRKEKWARNMTT